jgi:hypothetical protein
VIHLLTDVARMGRAALIGRVRGDHDGDMERIVATYHIDGHEVDVVEMVDEDRAWFELAVDGAVLPLGDQSAEPDVNEAAAVVRGWLAPNR